MIGLFQYGFGYVGGVWRSRGLGDMSTNGFNEGGEKRVRSRRTAFEFRVKLATNHKGMLFYFSNFY